MLLAPLDRNTRDTLWRLTAGHCGIIGVILTQLDTAFTARREMWTGQVSRIPLGAETHNYLIDPIHQRNLLTFSRAFDCIRRLLEEYSNADPPQYLQYLLIAMKFAAPNGQISNTPSPVLSVSEFDTLFRAGFLTPVNGNPSEFSFVAPIVRNLLVLELRRDATSLPVSCRQLVLDAIHSMRAESLAHTVPNEASYGNEFVAALSALLPKFVTILSEKRTANGKGRIDFLIEFRRPDGNMERWGFELLHNGHDRKVSDMQRIRCL